MFPYLNLLTCSVRRTIIGGMTTMTPAHTAAQDQTQAREREFNRRAHNIMLFILWLGFSLGVYSFLAIQGHVPPAPWSPVGQYQEQQQQPPAPAPTVPQDGERLNV